ncbi:hypothetical protein BC943DRAFT_352789 [Umbelopsis sp. AD052]|nr:hypothetical protein BC943DRAFT_352789 [Umbelopsis sp. AD052]
MLRAVLLLRTVIQPETTEFFPLFVSSFLFSMASNINSANRMHSPAVALPDINYSPRADVSSSQHLNNIFGAVRKQIEQWGDQAKWKIDLVLLENADGSTPQPESPAPNIGPSSSVSARQMPNSPLTSENGPRPSPSQQSTPTVFNQAIKRSAFQQHYPPQYAMPPIQHGLPTTYRPPIIEPPYASTADPNYPMRPPFLLTEADINRIHHLDDAKQKLRECVERINLLDGIARSQAEQIFHLSRGTSDRNLALETMRKIYLMNEHEHALRHSVETKMFQKDIRILAQKLKKAYAKVRLIESADISTKSNDVDRETLLHDRKTLLRKLRLSEMRSATKDVELDILSREYQKIMYNRDTPELRPVALRGPKAESQARRGDVQYLLQQGYSPVMRHDTPPLGKQRSGLDDLGIVANQMLTDMDKSDIKEKAPIIAEPLPITKGNTSRRVPLHVSSRDEKRSQRSIDSAAALVSMPTALFPGSVTQPDDATKNLDITNRSPTGNLIQTSSLWERRRSGSIYAKWSQEEDDMLRACVARHGNNEWEKVASDIPNRSYHQCRQRWMQLVEEEKMNRSSMDASHSPAISNLLTQQQPSLGSPSPPRSAAQDDEPRTPPHQVQYGPAHEMPRKPYEPYSTNLQERHSQFAPSSLNRQETLPAPQDTHSGLYRPPSPIATPKKRKIETMP